MEKLLYGWFVFYLRLLWWLCRLPVHVVVWSHRGYRRLRGAWIVATRDSLPCPGCRHEVSLIGRFRCSCGFTYDGYGFAPCPICLDIPPYLPCSRCGVGVMNPARF